MSYLRLAARRIAKDTTKAIAVRWGETFPFYYVSAYPKSGGTWLAQMLADYLQVPFPRLSIFPIGFEAVIQNHWSYDGRLRRVAYIYRDGRDVMTSFFFHRLRIARQSEKAGSSRVRRELVALFGEGYEDVRPRSALLARFIDNEFRRPGLGSSISWDRHVTDWYAAARRPHVAYVSYEQLREETPVALARIVEMTTGQSANGERIAATVEKFSMQTQTGRRPGEEDTEHHVRKGISGDWRNHFDRECAELFEHHAGEALLAMGYESDSGWVERAFPIDSAVKGNTTSAGRR